MSLYASYPIRIGYFDERVAKVENAKESAVASELYDSIFVRKSCRDFDMTPLPAEELDAIRDKIASFPTLYPDVKLEIGLVGPSDIRGMYLVEAPHYLTVFGTGDPREIASTGFLFEQWVLWMTTQGYGTVWLGMTRLAKGGGGHSHIVTIAFGRPADSATRTLAEFRRRPLSEIATGCDPRLEAARLAPSGMNSQPWYFIVPEQAPSNTPVIWVYRKRAGLKGLVYSLQDLDVGIALAHLALASERVGLPFSFSAEKEQGAPKAPSSHDYFGVVR